MVSDLQVYARKGLEAELARLDVERERVRALLASLGITSLKVPVERSPAGKRTRKMSEAGRQAIRDAVRRRWERVRAAAAGAQQKAASADGGHVVSAPSTRPSAKRVRKAVRSGNRKK